MDASLDMTFGQGTANFLIDEPETVAQIIGTRLRLFEGEWFLNETAGVPWLQKIVGAHTLPLAGGIIHSAILGSPGVQSDSNYSCVYDGTIRLLTVDDTVQTIFGQLTVAFQLPPQPDIFTLDVSPLDGGDHLV